MNKEAVLEMLKKIPEKAKEASGKLKEVPGNIKKHRGPVIGGAAVLITVLILLIIFAVPRYSLADVYDFSLKENKLKLSTSETKKLSPVFTVLEEKGVSKVQEEFDAEKVVFTSSDDSIAKVSTEGVVSVLKEGTAVIKAVWDEKEAEVKVEGFVPIEDISLQEVFETLNVGESLDIHTLIEPENATLSEGVTYTNLNPELIDLTEEGHVKANHPGYARIRMNSNGYEDFMGIRIYSPLKKVKWDGKKEETLIRGETRDFTFTFSPEDTTENTTPHYSVTDENIGTIDENGHFTALNSGDTTVKLKIKDYEFESMIHVIVPMEGIQLSFDALTIRAGDVVQIPIAYLPEDTTEDRTTSWVSGDPSVISVDANGVVTAVNAGQTTVTATCQSFSRSVTFTVVIPVSGVAISQGSAALNVGGQIQLNASVVPENTTEDRYISWASDNINVVTVENGLVTAVGPGDANIIASHGDFNAVCSVHVTLPMQDIEFEQPGLTLVQGYQGSLSVVYLPLETNEDRWVNWHTSDPSVAVVENGVVTAVSPGECTIYAYHNDLGTSAHVTVIPHLDVASITLSHGSIAFGNPGEALQLAYSIQPEGAGNGSVAFSSSNPGVATVSAEGVVTAVAPGSCTITAVCGAASASVSVSVAQAARNVVVMLDPGHDAHHTGADYYGIQEYVVNLKVSLACKQYLESHYSGVTVLMTHSDPSCPVGGADLKADLEHRAQMAQNAGAAILVSQHFNVSANHNASGCVAYISKEPNIYGQSVALANSILAQISASFGIQNRGCETANSWSYFDSYGNPLDYYAINRHSAVRGIPGIIVEHCFMDHPYDHNFLTNDAYLTQFGICDAIGIANYLGLSPR